MKEKLLMTNVKNSKNSEYYEKVIKELKERCQARDEVFKYDMKQTREKFKRCIGICKGAAVKIKTASGIIAPWNQFKTLLKMTQHMNFSVLLKKIVKDSKNVMNGFLRSWRGC